MYKQTLLPQALQEITQQIDELKALTPEQLEDIVNDPEVRVILGEQSFAIFMAAYLSHYWNLPAAEFHAELIALLEDWREELLSITGFRGSGKSSITALAFVLWCALFEKAHFIIVINETDEVGKLSIANIREELESNPIIEHDFGNIISSEKVSTKFSESNVLLANGVRIMARSRGQKIRGLRHRQYRPDLVIIDDCEEIDKVQSKIYRDKTERWVRGVVIPAIEELKARLIIIGNELHRDALMARLRKTDKPDAMGHIFNNRSYPLLDKNGVSQWAGKYPTQAALDRQMAKVGRLIWLREYLLKVIPEDDQIVKEHEIHRYKELPSYITVVASGVDLAISKKQTADYTTMVAGLGSIIEGQPKIYVLPKPIKARLGFRETISNMKAQQQALGAYGMAMFYVEAQSYQKAAIEVGEMNMLPITPITSVADKTAKLNAIAPFIQNGTVLFPESGAEDLIDEILEFGVAEHDDLLDALVNLIYGILQNGGVQLPEVVILG